MFSIVVLHTPDGKVTSQHYSTLNETHGDATAKHMVMPPSVMQRTHGDATITHAENTW